MKRWNPPAKKLNDKNDTRGNKSLKITTEAYKYAINNKC
jgi:hypothetical protein